MAAEHHFYIMAVDQKLSNCDVGGSDGPALAMARNTDILPYVVDVFRRSLGSKSINNETLYTNHVSGGP